MKHKAKKSSVEAKSKDSEERGDEDWADGGGGGPSEMGQNALGSESLEGNQFDKVILLLRGYLARLVDSGDGVTELVAQGIVIIIYPFKG